MHKPDPLLQFNMQRLTGRQLYMEEQQYTRRQFRIFLCLLPALAAAALFALATFFPVTAAAVVELLAYLLRLLWG